MEGDDWLIIYGGSGLFMLIRYLLLPSGRTAASTRSLGVTLSADLRLLVLFYNSRNQRREV